MARETPASRLAAFITLDTRPEREVQREKLRIAIALFQDGVSMKRAALRRRHPEDSEEALEARLLQWLLERPHEQPGERVSWPRSR